MGAATETELKDKKLRYEDALNSVKSALEMGVVPGGGACMLYMSCDEALKVRVLCVVCDVGIYVWVCHVCLLFLFLSSNILPTLHSPHTHSPHSPPPPQQSILDCCGKDDEDEKLGVEIMFRSLPAPMKQIAKNAGAWVCVGCVGCCCGCVWGVWGVWVWSFSMLAMSMLTHPAPPLPSNTLLS